MPPIWKIKREIGRVRKQSLAVPARYASQFFGAHYYDLVLAHRCRVSEGRQQATPRRAVYLIFPNHGVMPSHLRTIRHLAAEGFAVTVVSNLPLESAARADILELCHRCIERPNIGYDFGGYRDGVLSMAAELSSLEQLLLLNDSMWFPLRDDVSVLDDLAALGVDFASTVSQGGFGLVDPEEVTKPPRALAFDTSNARFHHCSFLLWMGPNVLRHPAFWRFWKTYGMISDKPLTVDRGEIGLTQMIRKHGFSNADLIGVAELELKLRDLSDARLKALLTQLIIMGTRVLQNAKLDAQRRLDSLSRDEILHHLMVTAACQGVSYSLAAVNVAEWRLPLIKKSPVYKRPENAEITLRILAELGTPAAEEAIAEIAHVRARQEEARKSRARNAA